MLTMTTQGSGLTMSCNVFPSLCGVCVCACVHTHVKVRDGYQGPFAVTLHFGFEAGALSEPRAH